jgi:hypothetical protein
MSAPSNYDTKQESISKGQTADERSERSSSTRANEDEQTDPKLNLKQM